MTTSALSPLDLAANEAPAVYAAAISTFVLASVAVALRIFARRLTAAKLWWDDWFIFVAYFFASGVFALTILWLKQGVGQHVEVVAVSNPNGITTILKSITPAEICYTLSILFAKYSILAFYSRIFGVATKLRMVIYIIGGIVTAWGISVIVVSAVTCVPLEALWNPLVPGKCIDLPKFYLGISFPNVITDWVMLLIPLSHIWNLKMPNSQKLIVAAIFIVGSFVCIVSLIRLIFIAHLDLVDITWGLQRLDLWTCVESFSSVFCACLPSLKPIYNTILGRPPNKSAASSAPSNVYMKSKSRNNTWNSTQETTKPNSFTRLYDDEGWAPTTTTGSGKWASDPHADGHIELQNV